MIKPLSSDAIIHKYVVTQENSNGELKKITFQNDKDFNFAYDIMDELAKKCPDKLALLHISNTKKERRFTFKEIAAYSSKTANYFKSLGIRKGDKVMLVLKRHYQFWFCMLALHKIGAVAIPASSLLVEQDYEYRFQAADVHYVVASDSGKIAEYIEKADRTVGMLKEKIIVGASREGWRNFNEEMEQFSDKFERPVSQEEKMSGEDIALMIFTSGTSIHAKLAAHNFRYPLGHFVTARYWNQVDPDGLHLTISDTGWAKAMWGKIYGQWLCEAGIFVYDFDAFSAKDILHMVEKYKITTFCAPPTMYRVLIRMNLKDYDLSSLQHVTTAGEALNAEVFYKFYEATGHMIYEGYGQTETTMVLGAIQGMEPKPGAMGKPNPLYDVAVMDKEGNLCPVGEAGEIVIRTADGAPNGLFTGYYNEEEKTAQQWHDGYYHTGDQARWDEDGYLWYEGRIDDLIKASGYRVGPFEIESELMKLPYVLECAVTSVPDKTRGQAIKASIVLTKGVLATELLKKEIFGYINENLASYKRPRIVEFVKDLPKTTSGKIKRVEIRRQDWMAN
ncbi:AMP-binding protein [[Clostridium] polysaccharolyticum]|uniref:Transcriptional regulator, XRE family with cupin sensor n=1 Tax=[Clostridium] polysaccharolyticum TaxID=29364 RepID=A0A1H9ZZX6_9FIRM|nr:AMP-binding protein [[Clostridium] polysaccharolyticum]SES86940.1 transcriptional regulator, XRE family with cupin sensor [[Clostridium] polysaccharolyticum]